MLMLIQTYWTETLKTIILFPVCRLVHKCQNKAKLIRILIDRLFGPTSGKPF